MRFRFWDWPGQDGSQGGITGEVRTFDCYAWSNSNTKYSILGMCMGCSAVSYSSSTLKQIRL